MLIPFQLLNYVNTTIHLVDHDRSQDIGLHSEDDEEEHNQHHHFDRVPKSEDLSHRHAPDQPFHNHTVDIWSFLSMAALSRAAEPVTFPSFVFLEAPLFIVDASISAQLSGSLFRPPIA